jgi:hypothetical protein
VGSIVNYRQLTLKKQEVLWNSRFFAVTADEVTTIDNGTWCSVTVYYMNNFAKESTMATLEHIEEGATSNTLTKVITKAMEKVTGMSREDIAERMLAFGAGKKANNYEICLLILCIIVCFILGKNNPSVD